MQVIHKPKPQPELMTQTELIAYVHELEAENARLEELYQKSVGVIAATDCAECKGKEYINDVNYAISCIRDFCKDRKCKTCPLSIDGRCSLGGWSPKWWENSIKALDEEIYGAKMDGGADNETD